MLPRSPGGVPSAAMRPGVVVLLLTLLLGIQPITTDLYLPALPTLQRDLDAGMGSTQLTLSALIICFGLAQLVAGPLADRHGRRPMLVGALVGYGLLMAGNSLCCIAGTWLCRRWLASVGLRAAVRRGAWFSLVGGLGMAAASIAGVHTWWALFVPQCVLGQR